MANKKISECKGCVWIPYKKKWRVSIVIEKRSYILGYYDTEEEGTAIWLKERERLWRENRVADLKGEEWRAIEQYGTDYWVSNKGRVKSTNYRGTFIEKLRTPVVNKFGYHTITIHYKKYFVHKLVARAFIGESSLFVNHKDSNKQNNCVENLEYVSNRSNVNHYLLSHGHIPGVHYCPKGRKYVSEIKIGDDRIILGRFVNSQDAHNEYMDALLRYGLVDDYNYISSLMRESAL